MSSIDKYVEQCAKSINSRTQVRHEGEYLVGRIDGQEVFRMRDRYGYINDDEKSIVRQGLQHYEYQQRQRALELARRMEEEARRRRMEEERVAAYNRAKTVVEQKRRQLEASTSHKTAAHDKAVAALARLNKDIAALKSDMPRVKFIALERKYSAANVEIENAFSQFETDRQRNLTNLTNISKQLTNNKSTEAYQQIIKTVSAISTNESAIMSTYSTDRLAEEIVAVRERCVALKAVSQQLNKLAVHGSDVATIVAEVQHRLDNLTVNSVSDVQDLINYTEEAITRIQNRLQALKTYQESEEIVEALSSVQTARERLREAVGLTDSYEVKDHREEIVKQATEMLQNFQSLAEQQFTTCSEQRITDVVERGRRILDDGLRGSEVLEEVQRLNQEFKAITERDKLHANEFAEYSEIVAELRQYGVEEGELPVFDAQNYSQVRRMLEQMRSDAVRASEVSQMNITNMTVQNIMEEMGYKLFRSVHDKEDIVCETLYTKKGCDGVMMQVIVCADGTVSRHLIGINKNGESQTDIDSVVRAARELEEQHEPEIFLEALREELGGELRVTDAADHDSEDARERIEYNGFCHLDKEGVELYDKQVNADAEEESEIQQTQAQTVVKQRPQAKITVKTPQVRTTKEQQVRSSNVGVQRAMQQARR